MAAKSDYREDRSLSLKAKGLYAMIVKLKADGKTSFTVRDLARLTTDGESTIKQIKQELERNGYLQKLTNNESVTIDGETFGLPNT